MREAYAAAPMERTDLGTMTNAMREALLGAGPDVRERPLVNGHAFLHPSGRAMGHIEERAGTLRARLWLPAKERSAFEARPTFDRQSGWIHVVSDEDVRFVSGLAPAAYRAATSGTAALPNASTVEVTPVSTDEKKKGAVRRPPSRTTRTRDY